MDYRGNQWDFATNAKMFALGPQGLWYDFSAGKLSHRGVVGAGIWAWLLELEERLARSGKKIVESPYEIRKRLMGQVLKKLEERDLEDLLTIISL